jgi:hypothetical protein
VQGGLLPPISAQDTSFPAAIREGAVRMVVGQTSQPITLEQGFAILRCERKVPGEGVDFATVEGGLRREVRLGAERLLMERQARTLMVDVDVTVLDADLDRVWRRELSEITTP